MLSKKMTSAFNAQIVAELYSSYIYMSMSAWLHTEGFMGSAKWMSLQVREEIVHAQKLYNFILERGGEVKLGAIDAPPAKWDSPLGVFEAALAHERKVTDLINKLMSLAKEESDHASEIFLQWFVTEQVEEEANASEIAQKYKLAGSGSGLFLVDRELGERTLGVDVQTVLAG